MDRYALMSAGDAPVTGQNLRPQNKANDASPVRQTPTVFAVQLQWSVQPIDAKTIPGHPIFHAYTLYAAEGRRAGRTWFFLRLGFFNDAVSAKQVAHYLRGDFASAAVVPVSPREQQQARQMQHSSLTGAVAPGLPRARQT